MSLFFSLKCVLGIYKQKNTYGNTYVMNIVKIMAVQDRQKEAFKCIYLHNSDVVNLKLPNCKPLN